MSFAVVRRVVIAATLLLVGRGASAQSPTHAYSLNGTFADALGGPSIEGLGGTLQSTGYRFGANQGLKLAGALNTDVYSVEFVFALDDVSQWNYRKLVDFTNLTADRGLYSSLGYAELYPESMSSAPSFASHQPTQLVITRDASNLFSAYVNGALVLSLTDNGGAAVFPTVGGLSVGHFLVDDQETAGVESASGFVDYLRVYDQALSSREVTSLYTPDQWRIPSTKPDWCITATPEPTTLLLMSGGLVVVLGVARQQRRRTV
jgi:hypothetical protein